MVSMSMLKAFDIFVPISVDKKSHRGGVDEAKSPDTEQQQLLLKLDLNILSIYF